MNLRRPNRATRLSAILRLIDEQSSDPHLNAVMAANLLGVTPRYVHLLLEETGRGFTHHVLEARLARAVLLLRDPQWRDRRIADVATEAGFTDISYFNRAFRRRYKTTPSNMRDGDRGGG
jgi:AraC-like DNA-binding protein